MHIQYDKKIDLEEVVELFATMHPGMIELHVSNLLILNVTVAPCCDTDC